MLNDNLNSSLPAVVVGSLEGTSKADILKKKCQTLFFVCFFSQNEKSKIISMLFAGTLHSLSTNVNIFSLHLHSIRRIKLLRGREL